MTPASAAAIIQQAARLQQQRDARERAMKETTHD